jgi:hypothetical protein
MASTSNGKLASTEETDAAEIKKALATGSVKDTLNSRAGGVYASSTTVAVYPLTANFG